jgi:hypothetical protein
MASKDVSFVRATCVARAAIARRGTLHNVQRPTEEKRHGADRAAAAAAATANDDAPSAAATTTAAAILDAFLLRPHAAHLLAAKSRVARPPRHLVCTAWLEPGTSGAMLIQRSICHVPRLETFRELQLLQTREITADDYDLLMLLHAKPNTKVLDQQQLSRVSTTFRAVVGLNDDCAVCLGSMNAGETLCRLACNGRHVFHHACISEWLTTASRVAPSTTRTCTRTCPRHREGVRGADGGIGGSLRDFVTRGWQHDSGRRPGDCSVPARVLALGCSRRSAVLLGCAPIAYVRVWARTCASV